MNAKAFPNFGQYKNEREGFIFNKEKQQYECVKEGGNKAILLFKGIKTDSKGYEKKTYRSSESDCKNCPLREQCCGKITKFKKIDDSIHKPYYDRMHNKLTQNKNYHRTLVKRRSATVEPVLGTLINYHNMRRVNTRGMSGANKHVLMAALTYNLKKYLRFTSKKIPACRTGRKTIANEIRIIEQSIQNFVQLSFYDLFNFNMTSLKLYSTQ